jgi:hypothetical protein
MAKRTNRVAWGLAVVLAVIVLAGIGRLFMRLRPIWLAKYHGEGADLHGALLLGAPLAGANLQFADLRNADLRGADLQGAFLGGALLEGADLRGAQLHGVTLCPAYPDVKAARLNKYLSGWLKSAYYDAHTRWPAGFDPKRHGAMKAN